MEAMFGTLSIRNPLSIRNLLMVVYIPTRGRVGVARQVTLREFLAYSDIVPVLVCPPDELKEHKKYAPRVIACPAKGIGPTRQWILERSPASLVVMADDDMRFSYRPDPAVTKLERCTDLRPMLDCIRRYVAGGFIHGGVGARQGNNRKDCTTPRKGVIANGYLVQDCERANNFHFFDRPAVLKAGGRLDKLPVMEDFYLTLDLLLKGYPNRILHSYVWNQEASGNTGGCSLYRTWEIQAQGAEGLAKAFPEYVKVVIKKSKDSSPAWRDFKERKDVHVQWLAAARAGGIDI